MDLHRPATHQVEIVVDAPGIWNGGVAPEIPDLEQFRQLVERLFRELVERVVGGEKVPDFDQFYFHLLLLVRVRGWRIGSVG